MANIVNIEPLNFKNGAAKKLQYTNETQNYRIMRPSNLKVKLKIPGNIRNSSYKYTIDIKNSSTDGNNSKIYTYVPDKPKKDLPDIILKIILGDHDYDQNEVDFINMLNRKYKQNYYTKYLVNSFGAEEINLEMVNWTNCMNEKPHSKIILTSNEDAKKLQLTGTPAFFVINSDGQVSKLFGAQPFNVFERVFDELLEK